MRTIYLHIITLVFALGFMSCEHSDLDVYSGKGDIYFLFGTKSKEADIVDSLKVNLGYDKVIKNDSVVAIPMKLFGYTEDFDRLINYTVTPEEPEGAKLGVDFDPLYSMSIVPAKSSIGYIFIKLYNTERIQKETLKLTIKTAPNEFFLAKYDELANKTIYDKGHFKSNIYKIYYDSKRDMPNMWADYPKNFNSLFGEFSKVKFEFMCETLNMTREYFTYDPEVENVASVFTARFPISLTTAWKPILKQSLIDYEKIHGKPLLDENDKPIVIP